MDAPRRNPKRMITTVDSHTAGHPTRVVIGGLPELSGRTVAEQRDDFRSRFDDLRLFLLHEPRGHAAMVGAVLTRSEIADFGAFFLGSYTYLEMCGHATIGLAVTLDHMGLTAPATNGESRFTLEVPAGVVTVSVRYEGEHIADVTFENVPAHVAARGVKVETPAVHATVDIAYGGNWYGLVEARLAGVALDPSGVSKAMQTGSELKAKLNAAIASGHIPGVSHPVDSILFYETLEEAGQTVSRQLVVIERNKFDRSPCGTGTSARLAQLYSSGEIEAGEIIRARNILGVDFLASATPLASAAMDDAVQPRVLGLAHVTGQHCFVLAPDDPLPTGFLCR